METFELGPTKEQQKITSEIVQTDCVYFTKQQKKNLPVPNSPRHCSLIFEIAGYGNI